MNHTTGSLVVSLLALGLPALMIVNLWLMKREMRQRQTPRPDAAALLRARAAALAASAAEQAARPPVAPARGAQGRGMAPLVQVTSAT